MKCGRKIIGRWICEILELMPKNGKKASGPVHAGRMSSIGLRPRWSLRQERRKLKQMLIEEPEGQTMETVCNGALSNHKHSVQPDKLGQSC